jgi:acetoin utilization deacetylase AcuC-like enzyme
VKILFDREHPLGLQDFGIAIPVRDSRALRAFEALLQNAWLASRRASWHVPAVTETVSPIDLARVHSPDYVARLFSDALEDELVRTYELIDDRGRYHRYDPAKARLPLTHMFPRILHRAAGTVQCARLALETGFCFYFGGGMHHAHRDFGHGFCLINDIVIAARKLQAEGLVRRVWVIDVDAHKGDGTAALTQGDPSVRTLSIHMARGWPLDGPALDARGRASPGHVPSDIDIPMAPGEEGDYLPRLAAGLNHLETFGQPDLAVVVSGADAYEADELPSARDLRLSLDQMSARDRLVHRYLADRAIPYAGLMAGGYGDRVWQVYARFLEPALLEGLAGGDTAIQVSF